MKILALYLPAFHQIPENDKWWGKGFTEWDNVKKGRPLFVGHIQPLIPLHGYYDLSEEHAIQKQAEYAYIRGIDGFVFYHYWFCGHQLFEKPVDNFLKDKKPNGFTYCLDWANETWARTWDGKDTEVLIKQEYGGKEDWLKHIEYLSTFFMDSSYLRIDDRPVFIIYSSSHVKCLGEMIACWNDYLSSIGLNKIYIIETMRPNNATPSKYADAVFEFEPMYSIRYDENVFNLIKRYLCKKTNRIDFQSYSNVWGKIIHRKIEYGSLPIFKSCFVSWDNSPRKGKKNSIILKGSTPDVFGKYFKQLLYSSRINANDDLVIINSWNEWGEGANLEPSVQYGESYITKLKQVKDEYLQRN
jgi:lipopolysaccharide biosynthesis protein